MNDAPITGSKKSRQLYWLFQVGGWSFYTVARIIAAITVLHLPWARSAVELLIIGAAGLLISHCLRNFTRRQGWQNLGFPQLAVRIVVAGFVLGTPLGIATQLSDLSLLNDAGPELQRYAPHLPLNLANSIKTIVQILNWAILYMIWLVLYFAAVGVREYRTARLRQSEMAQALQLAELRLLKSQLNPHFLFNALNTVRSLIADSPSRAQSAVTRLANTLRYTLNSRQDELVTFAQELGIVEDYLALESMRFEERLQIERHIPPNVAEVHIPVMLLQTLVENAIKHGIAELPSGGTLRILAQLQQGMLMVEIVNPRPSAPHLPALEGIGLRNARDRLRLLFGSRASLELDLSQSAVATARLRVPQHR